MGIFLEFRHCGTQMTRPGDYEPCISWATLHRLGFRSQGGVCRRVCIGHSFIGVTFPLQRKLALKEGSIASPDIHQQSDAMNSILEQPSWLPALRIFSAGQDSSFLDPKNTTRQPSLCFLLPNRKSRQHHKRDNTTLQFYDCFDHYICAVQQYQPS